MIQWGGVRVVPPGPTRVCYRGCWACPGRRCHPWLEWGGRDTANREAPAWDDNGNLTCDGRTDHQVFGTSTRLHFEYDYRNHLRRVSDDQDRTVVA